MASAHRLWPRSFQKRHPNASEIVSLTSLLARGALRSYLACFIFFQARREAARHGLDTRIALAASVVETILLFGLIFIGLVLALLRRCSEIQRFAVLLCFFALCALIIFVVFFNPNLGQIAKLRQPYYVLFSVGVLPLVFSYVSERLGLRGI